MILRPAIDDFRIIGHYIGRITLYLGLMMILPLTVSAVLQEWDSVIGFAIGSASCFVIGFVLSLTLQARKEVTWRHATVIAPGMWILALFLCAIPLYLSGHYGAFIDASFEVMSGFTTTGLSLVQDLDHLPWGINIWRHLMMFIGGQGIVLAAILFLSRGMMGAYHVYTGEGREEKILPNVGQTVRFIWTVSFVYLIVGTLAVWISMNWSGIPAGRALLHAACVFMAAFSTGGFAPQSQNILYYHSSTVEIMTIFLMIAGSLNFSMHFALWSGRRNEIIKNIETQTFFVTVLVTSLIAGVALIHSRTDPSWMILMRKGFYHVVSAHTTTGFMTVYPNQLLVDWKALGLSSLILAMGLGGHASSTAGGIKMMRVGLNFRLFIHEIKRLVSPPAAVLTMSYHHIKNIIMEDGAARIVLMTTVAFVFTYVSGAIIVTFYGYPLDMALFESVSAAANSGLSVGITSSGMPLGLKVLFIIQMWLGRLEFFPVFAFFGIFVARVIGR